MHHRTEHSILAVQLFLKRPFSCRAISEQLDKQCVAFMEGVCLHGSCKLLTAGSCFVVVLLQICVGTRT